jgi:pyruvate kinase
MRRTRNAKIIATLGPSSATEERIAQLFEAGADVFRLNFSHGTHDDHRQFVDKIRRLEGRFGRPIGIMADMQGPKLRVGDFQNKKVMLEEGQPFRLDLDPTLGDINRVHMPHPEIFRALEPEMDVLLNDGKIRLKVEKRDDTFAETRVMTGGELSNHKGVNVPSAVFEISPLTNKDRRDLDFALDAGADWIALSFVQRPEDVAEARKLIANRAGVLVKLEKPSALKTLDGILDLADAAMVARGDLGVELPPEDVPGQQKRIIRACRRSGKPVVVATQMLETMITSPTPTRAEASDVATAVYDGADAVMLSAESAAGQYPVEAVSMMNRIINRVERDPLYRRILEAELYKPEATAADAITAAANQVATTISASAIVTFTATGSTTLRCARERPPVSILGLTPFIATARRLSLVWGVHCIQTQDVRTFNDMVEKAIAAAKSEDFGHSGEKIVVTAGVPFGTPGATNILRIAWVD